MEPTPTIAAFVRTLRFGYEHLSEPVDERILPDGAAHLVFVMPTESGRAAHAVLLGASASATRVQLEGSLRHVEVELHAGATMALFGIAAADLCDRAVSLEEVSASLMHEIFESIGGAEGSLEAAATAVRRVLARRLDAHEPPPPIVGAAIARIRGADRLRVRELADELVVSERRLEQLFRLHVGLSPKRAMRLARFQRLLMRCAASSERPASWARVALEAGFADQSHLSNDVHAISGLTPVALASAAGFGFLQD
jgi:AraC-like DNA-binding protein